MGRKDPELPPLPPLWAPNYSAQVIHRLFPVLEAFGDISRLWQNKYYAWFCGNELDEAEELPRLPEEFARVKEIMDNLFDTADDVTLKRIITKLAAAEGFNASSIHSALIDLDLAPRIVSCIDPESGDVDLEMALRAASLIASMMSVNNRCNKQRKRSEIFGQSVDKVGEGLGKLLREHLWPRCETEESKETCLQTLSNYLDELKDIHKPSNLAEIEASFTWLTSIIRDPTTSPETLDAAYSVYSHVIPFAQFDLPFLWVLLKKFHEQDLYADMVKVWQREAETGQTNLGMQIDLILQVAMTNGSSQFMDEDTRPSEMDIEELEKRRRRFLQTEGAVEELRRRMLSMLETEQYEDAAFKIMSAFTPDHWSRLFQDGDDELFYKLIRNVGSWDDASKLLLTYKLFLSNPEAKAKCTNERHINAVIWHLAHERHQSAALEVLIVLVHGQDGPWVDLLIKRFVMVLVNPDLELMDVVENIFRLANTLLETDTARRIDIFRRYKIEPLCLHWATCTDGHQEEIYIPAAKLWNKLHREVLQVNAKLKKEATDFLVGFRQKLIEPEEDPSAIAEDGTEENVAPPERPLKNIVDDLQAQIVVLEGSQARPDIHATIAKLFNELCWYPREDKDAVDAAMIPLLADYVFRYRDGAKEVAKIDKWMGEGTYRYTDLERPVVKMPRLTKEEQKVFGSQDNLNTDGSQSDQSQETEDFIVHDEAGDANGSDTEDADLAKQESEHFEDGDDEDGLDSANDEDASSSASVAAAESEGIYETGSIDAQETMNESAPALENHHVGVNCDGCGQEDIAGTRYKCKQCADYDFCTDCHSCASIIHPEHTWFKFAYPGDIGPETYERTPADLAVMLNAHPGVACAQCQNPQIYGIRYECWTCERSFCERCHEEVTVICEVDNPGVPCCGFYIKEIPEVEADREEFIDEEAPDEEEAIEGADDVNEDEAELPPQEFDCTPEIQRLAKLTNAVLLACT